MSRAGPSAVWLPFFVLHMQPKASCTVYIYA